MRILVLSNLYPPAVRGGYELECAAAVDLLRARGHDVRVLTTHASGFADEAHVARDLHLLTATRKAIWTAARTTLTDRRTIRRHLESFRPDFAFVWNGAQISHAVVHDVLVSGTPTAFRINEHWFGRLFGEDLFMSYLRPGGGFRRRSWSAATRGLNRLPMFRLDRTPEVDVAVAWVSDFLRDSVRVPDRLHPVLERVVGPTTPIARRLVQLERRPSDEHVLAFVGRLSSEKGADLAIAALGRLTRDGLDARLVLAGPGSTEDRIRLERDAQSAGVVTRCTFVGQLDEDALADLLATADGLVVPSVWGEPLPNTVLEGALARIPIVAARIGGIPEAVVDGSEALLFAPGNVDELAAGMAALLTRPEEARVRAQRAYARAKARLDDYPATMTSFVDDAYRALSSAR